MIWELIDTAPKDGTPILGWDKTGMAVVQWVEFTHVITKERLGYWRLLVNDAFSTDDEWDPELWSKIDPPKS